jgi:chromosome segregation ATPase
VKKTRSASFELQVAFWALLGPFVLLLSFALAYMRSGVSDALLLSYPLLGLPLCLMWRRTGLFVAFAFGAVLLLQRCVALGPEEHYWLVAMSAAFSLGLLVSTQALEEARALIAKMLSESQSRLDNLLRLDAKLRELQSHRNAERDTWQARRLESQRELEALHQRVEQYERLVPIMRLEMEGLEATRSELLQELDQNREQRLHLDRELLEARLEVKGLTDVYGQSQSERERAAHVRIGDLERAITHADEQFMDIHRRLEHAQAGEQEAAAQVQQMERFVHGLRDCNAALEKELKKTKGLAEKLSAEQLPLQQRNTELERQAEALRESMLRADSELAAVRERLGQVEEEKLGAQRATHAVQKQLEELQQSAAVEEVPKEALAMREVKNTESVEELDIEEQLRQEQRQSRRWEGMYKQLHTQFQDKGRVLGETRAELFHLESELLRLQRELSEEKELSIGEVEARLQSSFSAAAAECVELESDWAWSEQAYQDLIRSLLAELSSRKGDSALSTV